MKKILSALVFVYVFSSLAVAQISPVFPMAFYGTATIDGNPAPVNTELVAVIDGVEKGSILTSEIGKYGGPSGLDKKLLVNGNSSDSGRQINFFVRTVTNELVEAFETSIFASGEINELNLNFPALPQPPAEQTTSTSNGGGGGSGGNSATILQPTLSPNGTESEINTLETNDAPLTDEEPQTVSPDEMANTTALSVPTITGFSLANPSFAGGILAAVLGTVYVGWRVSKSRKNKKKEVTLSNQPEN